jgi:hypothetical protein
VHTPEFAFEKDPDNVRRAIKELQITFPVPVDNDYSIWKAFRNQFWPADYLVDTTGRIRYHHFGEGKYPETETHIQELLKEHNAKLTFNGGTQVSVGRRLHRIATFNHRKRTSATIERTASSRRAAW